MTHLKFCSTNATMIPDMIHNLEVYLKVAEWELREANKLHKDISHPKVKAEMANYARTTQSLDAAREAVVVDFSDTITFMFEESPGAVEAMYEDVKNWEEISLPFQSFVLKLDGFSLLLIYEVTYEGDAEETLTQPPKEGEKFYNVVWFDKWDEELIQKAKETGGLSTYSKFPMKPTWAIKNTSFQVRSETPNVLALDDEYYFMDEADKAECKKEITVANALFYAMLFLLKHRKLSLPQASVPTSRNTKRIKRGQAPYSEYKVATLGDYSGNKRYYGKEAEGTHASPKMHIRCGHWRRKPFQTEKIWIHSTVVGDPSKGIVMKEYKL